MFNTTIIRMLLSRDELGDDVVTYSFGRSCALSLAAGLVLIAPETQAQSGLGSIGSMSGEQHDNGLGTAAPLTFPNEHDPYSGQATDYSMPGQQWWLWRTGPNALDTLGVDNQPGVSGAPLEAQPSWFRVRDNASTLKALGIDPEHLRDSDLERLRAAETWNSGEIYPAELEKYFGRRIADYVAKPQSLAELFGGDGGEQAYCGNPENTLAFLCTAPPAPGVAPPPTGGSAGVNPLYCGVKTASVEKLRQAFNQAWMRDFSTAETIMSPEPGVAITPPPETLTLVDPTRRDLALALVAPPPASGMRPDLCGAASPTPAIGDGDGLAADADAPLYDYYSFPSALALMQGDALLCSATRIGPARVLTAAHCVCGEKPTQAILGSTIYTGAQSETGYVERQPISPPPLDVAGFCAARRNGDDAPYALGDVALLMLHQDFNTRHLALDIRPTPSAARLEDYYFYMVGFGAHQDLWRGGVKRAVRTEVAPCDQVEAARTGCVPNRELVARAIDGSLTDSCKGDSGGGLYAQSRKTGELTLLGVISRGFDQHDYICGDGGIFVDVRSAPIPW